MADAPSAPDYRPTVFLPRTDFPMKAGLPLREPAILARWQEQDLEKQIRASRAGRDKFILHDGPPYANGDIHIGHALNHILKDMVVRTQTLLGKDAPYVPGWDCHGLPIEWKVEEQYRKKKLNKDEVPVREFRAECRAYAQHWVEVQREQLKRLGIGGQWDKPYLTMDFDAEATIVGELMKFAETGQVYRGAKPVMWSPVEKTALAEAEIEYEDVISTQIDVAFELIDNPFPKFVERTFAVIWTTTPWTIPVNQAIGFGPEIDYALIDAGGLGYIVAEALVDSFRNRPGQDGFNNGTIVHRFKGAELAGAQARHPMHHLGGFFAKPRPFMAADFVTTDQGTGLVHEAPDHGEEDFYLCQEHGIGPVFAVTDDGKYRDDWLWLPGQGSVINNKFNSIDGPILQDLQAVGALLSHGDFLHSYPHSWRSKAKVIHRCTPQWFIAMDRPISPLPAREGPGVGASLEQARSGIEPARASPTPSPSLEREGKTLRQLAIQAIADTRFVPEKGRNRIGSMVEGRPDWVISRQRAWGVPIALFVERKSGELLVDAEVNRRVVEAVRAEGVDAWSPENAARFLGADRNPDDYEMQSDILDVWFDSGCTHVFTLESGKWPEQRWPADLYLEGSDQHRGWFQSSLLESCGTRGRAPYEAVLTHGFTMDAKGMKMSKSLGNTVSPLDLMKEHGADILRLWALSVDSSEDHRIGKEILAGVADQYRKLRNTFRYLLGALAGFGEEEKVGFAEMPELERYMLNELFQLDAHLQSAIEEFDFNRYVRLLTDFCNEDLSAFYFDIRKDVLYCEVNAETGTQTNKRRSYRTVLDSLFEVLIRYAAPVLVFTSEEVWGTRHPEAGSVHLLERLDLPNSWLDGRLASKYGRLRLVRDDVLEKIEPLRREKQIRSSLEAEVELDAHASSSIDWFEDVDLAELFISSEVRVVDKVVSEPYRPGKSSGSRIVVNPTSNAKCGRCWRHLPEVREDGGLCGRCEEVVNA